MMTVECDYRKLTSRFQRTLSLPADMFNPEHDYCFCDICHKRRGDNDHYKRGNPANIYVLPRKWRRFGIKISVPKNVTAAEVWRSWHVAFHGTRFCSVESIWRVGLRLPGEKTFRGSELVELCGHFNDFRKPEGFDTKQIFVSPSIKYSGGDEYAPTETFDDPVTKTKYKCKVAFQLRIQPSSYNIGPKTTSRESIDPYIDDNILEWSTKAKPSIVLTGLLIRMDK